MKKGKRKKLKIGKLLLSITLSTLIMVSFVLSSNPQKEDKPIKLYVASANYSVELYDKTLVKINDIFRGQEVYDLGEPLVNEKDNIIYNKIKYNNQVFYINKNDLVSNKDLVIKETQIFVRTTTTIYDDPEKGSIAGSAKKGENLSVLGYDKIIEDGKVNLYKIKYNEITGYIYSKYATFTKDEAIVNYEPTTYYDIHNKRGNRFNGGHAGHLDYYPVTKPTFDNNIMPEKVYALYLNGGSYTVKNIDEYINYAKTTKINAFVVDIKDNQSPAYKSPVYATDSPTNYRYANNSLEQYKNAIKKIKDAGFYVIGRITVFKDKYYVDDNPDVAILDTRTGKPFLHANTYWPSPYQRKVWKFNVDLAKDAVQEMGFNEIQFDYVRFPDRAKEAENNGWMDFRNTYNEEKAQAVQQFLMYACDELHKLGVYVSADVFGESAYTYVTAYGQYWPAISNVVDVISGMPYPDHFNKHEFDFKETVWTVPYKLLNFWASNYVVKRQKEIPTPAIVRNWIQVYDAKDGYKYGAQQIEDEINGLFEAGLDKGYMTWLSTSNLDRYKTQQEVYSKEY